MLLVSLLAAAALAAPLAGPGEPSWTAPLPPPVQVLRGFDPPAVRWSSGHRGVDLSAPVNAVVRSAGDGRIAYAARLAGRGVVVVVHGELRTTYEPVTASVGVGQQVAAGDSIGVLAAGHDPSRGASGVLHWGLRRGETYLDPMALLRTKRPVRLLPRWRSRSNGTSLHAQPGPAPPGSYPSAGRPDGRPVGNASSVVPRSSPPPGRSIPVAPVLALAAAALGARSTGRFRWQ